MLTSVNEQVGKQISFDIEKDKAKKLEWKCPVCGQETTYVKKSVKGKVEHFRHLSASDHPSLSESKLHAKAKKEIFELLKRDNNYIEAELENPVGNQIIDIYLKLSNGDEVAVEIQCSPQGKQKFKERTEKYDEKGIYTLWLLKQSSFFEEKTSKHGSVTGTQFKDSVGWIQNNWYGRTYRFSERSLETKGLTLKPTRLEKKTKIKKGLTQIGSSNWEEYTYNYTYDTIADFVDPIPEKEENQTLDYFGLLTVESFDFKIARFYDKKWWE